MTSAGWYPDPAGAPGAYRYWDGTAWSRETSTDPFGQGLVPPAPPVAPAPLPPAPLPPTPPPASSPYGALPPAPAWSPMPGAPVPATSGGSATGRTIAIICGAVAFVVVLVVIAIVAVSTLGNEDGVSTASTFGDQTPSTIPGMPTAPGAPAKPLGSVTPTTMQCEGGLPLQKSMKPGRTLTSGGLTAPSLARQRYRLAPMQAIAFTFIDDPVVVSREVSPSWVSPMLLGALRKDNGFTSPEQAARALVACMADDAGLYPGAYAITDVGAGTRRVDGHPAYSLTQEIKVHDPAAQQQGDTVQVVVVDTGRPHSYGVFLMAVPIGDQALLRLQKTTAEQLHVR